MKSQKEQRRATKSNEKQQKATKSKKKQQRTSELEKPKRARKNQDEQRKAQRVQMETRLKAWFPVGLSLAICCQFWFFLQQQNPKRAMRCSYGNMYEKPNERQKVKQSNKRDLPVLVFEIEKTRTSNEEQ